MSPFEFSLLVTRRETLPLSLIFQIEEEEEEFPFFWRRHSRVLFFFSFNTPIDQLN